MIFKIGPHTPQIHPSAFIHPTAEVSGKVKIGSGVSIWGGCVLRGDVDWIEIGDNCNIQDGTILHTSVEVPVIMGQGVTVGHRVVIHGAKIRSYSLIGMGAVLLDHVVVEENCIVGAGALVSEKTVIPKGHLAMGVPAKVKRPVRPDEVKLIHDRAAEYLQFADTYKKALP